MLKILIDVTQDHIIDGEPGSDTECAIALAVRDVFPNASIGEYIYLDGFGSDAAIPTPKPILDFINAFDIHALAEERVLWVEPCRLELEIPDHALEALRLPAIEELIKDSAHLEIVHI